MSLPHSASNSIQLMLLSAYRHIGRKAVRNRSSHLLFGPCIHLFLFLPPPPPPPPPRPQSDFSIFPSAPDSPASEPLRCTILHPTFFLLPLFRSFPSPPRTYSPPGPRPLQGQPQGQPCSTGRLSCGFKVCRAG